MFEPEASTAAETDDGLAAELARAQPRRWWNRATPWLLAAVLLVGGFAAGAQVQKTYGPQGGNAAGSARTGGQFAGRAGYPGGGGFPGGAGNGYPGTGSGSGTGSRGGGNATTGTVKLVDGSTIYVETESGELVTVRTNGDTTVALPGRLSDLKEGDRVSVQGESAGDSEVTADTVTARR
ncbi:hypothetical protein CIK06_01655 [Plantactinospora sp. KBS50]|nr:hypothetical protein CIK06_01655 [Plantactinospora sp. KBS50]